MSSSDSIPSSLSLADQGDVLSSGLVLSSLCGNTEREREEVGEQGESLIGE